jgi:hypothetical protein
MVQGGHGTWRLAPWILLLLLGGPFVYSVSGATVTLAPRASAPYGITIANKFGYLNVTNTQALNSFTDYANGTVFFDVRGLERNQITYSYLARAFGNGTFDLRFQTSGLQPRVTSSAGSTPFLSSSVQVVDYSSSITNDPLVLVFQGTASQQLFNAAVYGSFFFGVIMTSIGVLYGVTLFGRVVRGFDPITGNKTPEPQISTTQVTIIGLMVIIGFGIMIVIAVFFGNVLKGLGS